MTLQQVDYTPMKALLSAHPMHAEAIGKWENDSFPGERSDRPPADHPPIKQYFLYAELCWRSRPDVRIPVKALLDTGCDITSISTGALHKLETVLQQDTGEMLPLYRNLVTAGVMRPTYDLAFILPATDHAFTSDYGFVWTGNTTWWGHTIDMLLGQDLINQWVVTYDGINGTLTIAVP